MSDLHVIRKQIFQFRLEEESQYRLLARRISELGDRILPEALDEVLSDFVPEGVHIVIDRLELDIGVIHPDEIREQLANRIVAALRQSLQAIGTGRQPGVARVADGPGRQAAILEHFVRHGRLPWWAGSRNVSIREYARKLTEADPALITRIFGQYIQDPPRMKRLLQHLDTPALIKAWSRSHPESKAVSEPEMAGIIREVTRHLQVQYGSDRAVEMIRFQLLQGLLQQTRRTFTGDGRSIGSILSGGVSRLAGVLLTEIPVTGWIDFSRLITDLPRRESGRLTKPEAVDRHKDSRTLKLREALSGGEGAPGGPPAGKPPSDEVSDRELAAFGGFLRQGTISMRPSASLSGSVVSIFRTLIRERLQKLAGMIRDLGKADRVRKRILDSIPSPRLRTFFEAAVPGKKEAMEWVESVYLETQRKVRPINQTNIRVQRSVDEITLELFTTTDLNAISNLAFMRFHIRRMALKHHIRYRDLIRAIWRSSNLYRISPDGRLFAILKELYEEAFPLRKLSDGRHAPDSTDRILVDDQIRPADRVALDPGWEARQAERIHEDLVREIKGPQSSPLSTPEGGGEQRPRINEDLAPGLAADSATILPRRSEDSRSDIKQGRSGDLTEDFSTDDGVPVQTRPSSQVSDAGGVADSSFAGPIPENKAGIAAGTVLEADRTAIRPMTGQSTGKDITSGSTADGKSSREAGSLSADDLAAPVGATSDMQNRQTSGPTIDKLVSAGTAQALQANAESDARDPDGKGRSSDLSDGQGSEGIGDADVDGSDTAPLLDGRQWKSNDPASRSMTSGQMDDRTRLAIGPTNDLGTSPSSRQNSEEDGLQPASTASGTQQARATSDTSTSSPGGKEEFGYPEAADRSRTGGSGIAGTDQRTASGQISPTFGLEDSIAGRIQEGKGPGSLSAGIPGDGNEVGAGGDRAADQGGIRTPIDLLEPVPQGLLDILPRSVVRALIMVKATQVFGRHTRTLQELISTYIRISSPVAISLDDADIPALMAGLSEYLGVEQSFLIFAFSYSARVHGNDPVAVRVAERFAAIQQVEMPLPMNTADGLVTPLTDALVRHLTAYRWYYEATHIKSLLLPGIRGRRISPAQFSSILRLLYDDRAEIVEAEWTKLIGRSYAVSVRVDAETLIDEARHVFIEASLDAGTVSFGLQRIFARVRRILQPETSGATILPARLSEIRGYFTPDPGLQPSAGGRKKLQLRRENAIIRFYNLLNLDLVLEGVGERFFDNIPFSFELLLTKHRIRLLEILHTHRFDEELAHFFSYSDPSRLFEQIRKLYPRAHIDRVSRIFTQATELLSRARWLTLGREELQSFAGLDAFAFYLSPDSPPPAMSEVVFDVLRRASAGGLLSDSFKKMFDESTDARILSQVARRIGVRRRDLLFPVFSSESMLSDRRGLIRFRELVRSVVGVGEDEAAVLTLQAVLTTGRFPEGHVLREAVPAAHPEYLKRLVSRGNTIERLFSDSGMDLTALPEGLLDRGQLTRAVAARFRIRRDQARRLTQSWFDRAAGTGWRMEDLLESLLQSPAPSPKQPGNQVLNRAAAKLLIDAGRSSWWELLLQTGEAGSVSDPSLAGVRPEDVLDRVRGSREDWMELYFGLMQGPTDVSMSVRRAMAVWMRVLAFQPGGSSRRIRFRSLVNFVRQGITAGAATEEKLHLAWLDAGRFFDRLPPSSVLVVYGRLLKAGMEPGVIDKHLVSAGISPPDPVQKEQLRSASASEISDRVMRGLVTPEEIARLWRPGRRDAAAMLTALKRWVSSRYWNAKSADRLARQLPPQAMQSLLESLFIGVDIHRIVEAWSVFLQRSGLFADRARAVAEIRKQLFTQRLWSHLTNRRIQVELMVSLGIPEAMHRGNIPADVIRDGIDGVPGVFLKLAADLSATRPDLSVDELLPIWPLAWTDSSVPSPVAQSDRSQRVPGIGPIPQSVMDFLETGLFTDQVPGIDPETINNQMADAVRLAGPGTFLTLPSLHESLEGRVLEFFDPTVLSDYIFSTLQDTVPDAALRRYLGVLADLAAHTRVSMSDLLRFLKTFRRFFTRGKGGGVGQPEAFLRASLGIPAFAKLAHRSLSAMPVAAFRTTRSPFLQHIIRKSLTGGRARRPDLHALGVYFLRTGLLHPDAVGIDLSGLSERLRERLLAGDPDLRATIFLYAKDRLARRRVRELLDALPERDIYAWIQPGLPEALRMLTDIFSRRLRIDIWRAVGARTVRDRLERILFWWSQTRPVPGHPVRLLRPFLSQVLMVMDERQWDRIRNPDLAVFTLQEKSLWAELRALLPELIQAPADGERRLAQPETEGTEGPRMNDPDMDSNPADGITVQNGGLVILWPYLGRLFTRLGFSDGKTFSSEEDQSRAIRLTEYLVTGMTEMEEHQLALNKVICGASLEFQVPASIDLTPEEEEICGKMLQGVIRNWEKMKTTRPNTFRETFLKREARLYKVEDRWELVVSRKAYDMLLDSLPWNISMIQLSWMPERLVVHWK